MLPLISLLGWQLAWPVLFEVGGRRRDATAPHGQRGGGAVGFLPSQVHTICMACVTGQLGRPSHRPGI